MFIPFLSGWIVLSNASVHFPKFSPALHSRGYLTAEGCLFLSASVTVIFPLPLLPMSSPFSLILFVHGLFDFFFDTVSQKSLFAIFCMVSSSPSADLFCFHRITSVLVHIWGPLCNVNHGLFSFGFIFGIWCLYQKLVNKFLTWNCKFQTYKTLITWLLYSSFKIHYTVVVLCNLANMLAGVLAS